MNGPSQHKGCCQGRPLLSMFSPGILCQSLLLHCADKWLPANAIPRDRTAWWQPRKGLHVCTVGPVGSFSAVPMQVLSEPPAWLPGLQYPSSSVSIAAVGSPPSSSASEGFLPFFPAHEQFPSYRRRSAACWCRQLPLAKAAPRRFPKPWQILPWKTKKDGMTQESHSQEEKRRFTLE